VFFISILLILSIFQIVPDLVIADDHKTNKRHYKRYENSKEHRDYDDHKRRWGRKDDEGNETTGQTAAGLLVAANLTVAFSILMKGASRFLPLVPQTKSSFKNFNKLQKKTFDEISLCFKSSRLVYSFFSFSVVFLSVIPPP